MADPKIFCIECIFYVPQEPVPFDFGPPIHQLEKCLSPNNFKDTHVTPGELPISQPKVINRFNNCVWFSPKHGDSSSCSSGGVSSSSSSI